MIRYLIGTNVLLYTIDPRDSAKQQRAIQVLSQLSSSNDAGIPAQVFAEYANVTLKKFGLPASSVFENLQNLTASFTTYPLSPAVVLEAVRGVRDHQLSYFDAQIWAVAKLNQIPVVLSEDFNIGATLEGVQFLNPFDKSFNLTSI